MLKYTRKHVWFQIKETGCFSLWLVQCEPCRSLVYPNNECSNYRKSLLE